MIIKIVTYFLLISLICSCGKTIKLKQEDYRWIPYKGNETLVFISTTGESDTIFLTRTGSAMVESDPLDLSRRSMNTLVSIPGEVIQVLQAENIDTLKMLFWNLILLKADQLTCH